MFIRYGTSRLDVNSATVSFHRELLHVNMVPYGVRADAVVRGIVLRDSPAALAVASANWSNATIVGNKDLALCFDSGAIVQSLPSGSSLSGVLCLKGPDWDDNPRGATFATMREFVAVFAAEYPVTGASYLKWQQTITLSGGTPVYVELPSINGPWQQQMVSPSSPAMAVQSGMAIGINGEPPIPGPMFNAPLVAREVMRGSPERIGLGFRGWQVSWSYTFRTVGALQLLSPGLPPL